MLIDDQGDGVPDELDRSEVTPPGLLTRYPSDDDLDSDLEEETRYTRGLDGHLQEVTSRTDYSSGDLPRSLRTTRHETYQYFEDGRIQIDTDHVTDAFH